MIHQTAAALALVAALSLTAQAQNLPPGFIDPQQDSPPQSIKPSDIRVIDGDTIQVWNRSPNVRLVGFDAPETSHSDCDGERQLSLKATERLREIIRAGQLTFGYVRCSCPESKIGTHWCNYGRNCGTLKANGRDVGHILIKEGLAVPFKCGATSCPKKSHPSVWCDGSSQLIATFKTQEFGVVHSMPVRGVDIPKPGECVRLHVREVSPGVNLTQQFCPCEDQSERQDIDTHPVMCAVEGSQQKERVK
jgi:endonuclease YncB( thermonuclease family)